MIKDELSKVFQALWDFESVLKDYENPYEKHYPEVFEKLHKQDSYYDRPKWSYDCGMKMDYDGPVVQIFTRIYPLHKNDNKGWGSGSISVYIKDKEIKQIPVPYFNTFEEVSKFVENKVEELINEIEKKLENL